ncbi:MAG: sugar ABC transporter substrate-binding protein [Agathobacter sp.]|nr:sugar ABC transporter substrate-binding protein [Agathobacter sp.]
MKKKVISVMLVSAMVASMAAGCGSSNGGSSNGGSASNDAGTTSGTEAGGTTASATTDDPNTLTVYAWDKNFNIPALEAAAAAYKEKNPDFNLEIIEQSQASDIEDAITLAGSSGDYSNLPDIVLFQDHYFQQYATNYPDAWTDVADADVDWSDFGEEKLSFSTIDGTHYGFPVDNGTVICAYRTDLLDEAGYTIDDLTGCSWDDFIEIGKAVYEKTGKYLLSMDGDGNDLVYMMLQAEGVSQFKDGEPYIADNETLKQVVEKIVEMANENVLYLANDWSDYTDQTIIGDQVAGVMNGNWIIPTIEQVAENAGKWEITSMPTLAGGEGYASNGGSSLYITGNCHNTDLAKDFLAYTFGGGDGAIATYDAALTNGGVITTCISAGQSEVYNQGVDYFNGQSIYADIVEMGSHVKVVEQSDYHYDARSNIATAIINIIGGADLQSELDTAESNLRFTMGL